MPLYEARITIKPAATPWRFAESDIESAKVRLQDEVDNMIDQYVKAGVVEVEK